MSRRIRKVSIAGRGGEIREPCIVSMCVVLGCAAKLWGMEWPNGGSNVLNL